MAEKSQEKPPDTFDPTDLESVAAYIDAHGLEAFRTERQRQTGYTETVQTTAPVK